MKQPLSGPEPRRLLMIQLRQIGDVLLTTPLVAAVRRKWPSAYLAYAVDEKAAPILRGNPDLDALIVRRDAESDRSYYGRVRRQRFELVIDLLRNPRSGWITLASGAETRVGWEGPGKALIYNVRPAYRDVDAYTVEDKGRLLAPLGIAGPFGAPTLRLDDADRETARSILRRLDPDGPTVVIAFSSPRPSRRWTTSGWAALCSLLSQEGITRIVIAPGPGDEAAAEGIRREAVAAGIEIAPPMSLREHAGLIEAADLLIGVCSAPRHIALAVGTPSLVVTGPTKESAWTWPDGRHRTVAGDVPCRPCHRRDCPDVRCMTSITPRAVHAAAMEMLDGARRSRGQA